MKKFSLLIETLFSVVSLLVKFWEKHANKDVKTAFIKKAECLINHCRQ